MPLTEQAILKMGLDSKDVEEGANRVTKAVQETGEKGHKSFLHAGSAARGFHKTLEAITEQSPILGRALQIAISPIFGVFAAAAAALVYFHEKFKELNAQMDKFSEWAAKPTQDFKGNMREAAKSVEEVRREFDKWLKSHDQDATLDTLNEKVAKLNQAAAKAKAGVGNDPNAQQDIERKRLQLQFKMESDALRDIAAKKMKTAGEVDAFQKKVDEDAHSTRSARAKQAVETEKEMQQQIAEELKKKKEEALSGGGVAWAAAKNLFGFGPGPNEAAQEKMDEISRLESALKASKKRMDQQERAIDREASSKTANSDKLKEAQAKFDKEKGIFETLSKAVESSRLGLAGMPPSAIPTISPIQQKINDWQAAQKEKLDQWNVDHGLVKPITPNSLGFTGTPASLSTIQQVLTQMLHKYESGVKVFGDDSK